MARDASGVSSNSPHCSNAQVRTTFYCRPNFGNVIPTLVYVPIFYSHRLLFCGCSQLRLPVERWSAHRGPPFVVDFPAWTRRPLSSTAIVVESSSWDSKGQQGADPNTEQKNGRAPIPGTGYLEIVSGASVCVGFLVPALGPSFGSLVCPVRFCFRLGVDP